MFDAALKKIKPASRKTLLFTTHFRLEIKFQVGKIHNGLSRLKLASAIAESEEADYHEVYQLVFLNINRNGFYHEPLSYFAH